MRYDNIVAILLVGSTFLPSNITLFRANQTYQHIVFGKKRSRIFEGWDCFEERKSTTLSIICRSKKIWEGR